MCTGGVDPDDPDNPIDNQEHGLMAFFRDHLASFLNKGIVKFFIIIIFAAYLAGAGYGITQIQEGLERRKIARADSYSIEFFDREDLYFREFPYRIQVRERSSLKLSSGSRHSFYISFIGRDNRRL